MKKAYRVLAFTSEPGQDDPLLQALKKHGWDILITQDLNSAQQLIEHEMFNPDLVTMPLKLQGGMSATAAALQLKLNAPFNTIPLIVSYTGSDKLIVKSLYDSGADIVLTSPWDADLLNQQLQASLRWRASVLGERSTAVQQSGLLHPIVDLFHSIHEGLLLFSLKNKLLFLNAYALSLFQISEKAEQTVISDIQAQFKNILIQHRENQAGSGETGAAASLSHFEQQFYTSQKELFSARASVTSIYADDGSLIGYGVAIRDFEELRQLAATIEQSQRTRVLCLFLAAANINLLQQSNSLTLSPLSFLEGVLQQEPIGASIETAVHRVLETVDAVTHPGVSIKVKIAENLKLGISAGDLFQLLGLLLMFSVEYVGRKGEINIQSGNNQPGKGVPVTIQAQTYARVPSRIKLDLAALLETQIQNYAGASDFIKLAAISIQTSENIARRYRTNLEYQDSDTTLRIRFYLPITAKA